MFFFLIVFNFLDNIKTVCAADYLKFYL